MVLSSYVEFMALFSVYRFFEQNSFFTPLAISLQFLFRLFSGFSVVEYLSGHKNNIKLDEIGFPDAACVDIVFHMFSRTQDSL